MANPVLNRAFKQPEPTTAVGQPQQTQQTPYQQAPQQATWNPEVAYQMPAATAAESGRMTVDDVVVKTSILLGMVVIVAAIAAAVSAASPELSMTLWIVGAIGGLVLGLVNAFRKQPSVPLIMAYAVFQGMLLGALSWWANAMVPGVVGMAVLATFIVAGISLTLYRTGAVKVTKRFRSILMVAMISYLIFIVVNLVAMIFMPMGLFGIRSLEMGGVAAGLLIGLIAVFIAAMSLIADFDMISRGVQAGAPARYAWTAAFGIMVTLIWMYIEILRILLIVFNRD